ncbi:MAG: DUF932 domain-containing protein [Pseudonocardiaceae bacterium]
MVALLQRQHDVKLDVVVPARDIRMRDGELHIDGIGEPALTPEGVTPARGVFRPTLTCDGGIAEKLGIPPQYLRRMRETHPALLDHNVNTWLADDPAKRYLIRTLRSETSGPGIARAMLSEKYKITDNLDVLLSVLDGIRRTGVQTQISRCDLTEKRMYVKVRSPEVAARAPRLLADYRSPFSGLRGADNPLVFAGFVISNSETGHGSFSITPQVTIQVCDDGMTFTTDAMREVHLGGRLQDGVIRWSADTQDAALELVVKQARDAVTAFLTTDYVAAKIAEVEAEAGIPVRDVDATLEYVGKQLRFTAEQQQTILNHFIDGADRSAGGVLHAVTSTAQTPRRRRRRLRPGTPRPAGPVPGRRLLTVISPGAGRVHSSAGTQRDTTKPVSPPTGPSSGSLTVLPNVVGEPDRSWPTPRSGGRFAALVWDGAL